MKRLAGKVALVTGAARGLGESIAREIVAEGGVALITDVNEELGKTVAGDLGDRAMFISHDVSRAEDWQEVIRIGETRFGPIAILVNNAVRHDMAPFQSMTVDEFRAVFEVNELGCFLGMQAILPTMRRAGKGSIVNISSIAGMHPSGGMAYCASKWAIRGMTKSVAHELAAEGIRANSVHPGWMRVPSTASAPTEKVEPLLPMRRVGEPEEVAKLVVFLASDDASLITGSEYLIDGGALLMGTLEILDLINTNLRR